MENCWAHTLGGCSTKISREHIITKRLTLDDVVSIQGLPWCADVPMRVGLANVTAKMLCTTHNSALSEVDDEAIRFGTALRESFRLLEVRHRLKKRRWTIQKLRVDGLELERWFLKTLINVAFKRGFLIGPDSKEVGYPSTTLVEIAFGKRRFDPGAGLYGLFDSVEKRPRTDGISIRTLNKPASRVLGAVFSFLGFRLALFLDSDGPPLPLMEIGTGEGGVSDVLEPTYHPLRIAYTVGGGLSHAVEFLWPVDSRISDTMER